MWSVFEVPIDRVCRKAGCRLQGQLTGRLHEQTCGECGDELALVTRLDRRALTLAIGGAFLLTLLLVVGLRALSQQRAAARDAALLQQAKERLDGALGGARASQVGPIVEAIEKELSLSADQRRRLLEAAAPQIAMLPRDLSPELQPQLEKMVRSAYGDGTFSADERAEVDRFIVGERLARESAEVFISELETKLAAAGRSLSRGRLLVEENLPAEAREEFERATQIDPRNSMAWANLGAANMLLGHQEEGLDGYQRAIELDPRNWLAHFNLAMAAARRGERRSALDHISSALASLPPGTGRERRVLMRDLMDNPAFAELRKDPRFSEMLEGAEFSSERNR